MCIIFFKKRARYEVPWLKRLFKKYFQQRSYKPRSNVHVTLNMPRVTGHLRRYQTQIGFLNNFTLQMLNPSKNQRWVSQVMEWSKKVKHFSQNDKHSSNFFLTYITLWSKRLGAFHGTVWYFTDLERTFYLLFCKIWGRCVVSIFDYWKLS